MRIISRLNYYYDIKGYKLTLVEILDNLKRSAKSVFKFICELTLVVTRRIFNKPLHIITWGSDTMCIDILMVLPRPNHKDAGNASYRLRFPKPWPSAIAYQLLSAGMQFINQVIDHWLWFWSLFWPEITTNINYYLQVVIPEISFASLDVWMKVIPALYDI